MPSGFFGTVSATVTIDPKTAATTMELRQVRYPVKWNGPTLGVVVG